jgi:PqqD family protein of HPr-rel-A system
VCRPTSSPATPPKWAVNRSASLSWKRFDDEFIVFNASSGDTHLLNLISTEALRCLEESPTTAAELSRRVAERLGLFDSEDTQRQVAELLSRLDELGLVESVPR